MNNSFKNTRVDLVKNDPSSPKEGQFWINLTENKVKLMADPIGEPIVLVDFNSAGSGNDLNTSTTFTNVKTIDFTHNLGKVPSVVIVDLNGYEMDAQIQHINLNRCVITFINNKSGKIYFN